MSVVCGINENLLKSMRGEMCSKVAKCTLYILLRNHLSVTFVFEMCKQSDNSAEDYRDVGSKGNHSR